MPRISGIDIPPRKKVKISLRYIYGIGPANAMDILKEANIDPEKRADALTEEEIAGIVSIIDRGILVEGALRRKIAQDVGRLREIGSYRGMRHRRSLPVRGQRTRSNARSRKGPAQDRCGQKGR